LQSSQLADADLRDADLVVAMAREHVRFVRRRHPEIAARTATLKRLVRDYAEGSRILPDLIARGLLPWSPNDTR